MYEIAVWHITNMGFIISWVSFCLKEWIKWNWIQKIFLLHCNNNCMSMYCKKANLQIKWYLRWSWVCGNCMALNCFLHLAFSLLLKNQPLIFPWYSLLCIMVLYSYMYTLTAHCCVFHYKQKERNQYKSTKSIVIITRIIISLQSFRCWNELTT